MVYVVCLKKAKYRVRERERKRVRAEENRCIRGYKFSVSKERKRERA